MSQNIEKYKNLKEYNKENVVKILFEKGSYKVWKIRINNIMQRHPTMLQKINRE